MSTRVGRAWHIAWQGLRVDCVRGRYGNNPMSCFGALCANILAWPCSFLSLVPGGSVIFFVLFFFAVHLEKCPEGAELRVSVFLGDALFVEQSLLKRVLHATTVYSCALLASFALVSFTDPFPYALYDCSCCHISPRCLCWGPCSSRLLMSTTQLINVIAAKIKGSDIFQTARSPCGRESALRTDIFCQFSTQ